MNATHILVGPAIGIMAAVIITLLRAMKVDLTRHWERINRQLHIYTLHLDIAGYEDDLATIRMLGQAGSANERAVLSLIADLKHELFLATRKAAPAAAITN